jgi:hypothetical protein
MVLHDAPGAPIRRATITLDETLLDGNGPTGN